MGRLKNLLGVFVLLAALSLGASPTFADGQTETPGRTCTTTISDSLKTSVDAPTVTSALMTLVINLITTVLP